MRLEQLKGFKFIGSLKQGCFIFCPECMVGSCHVDWLPADIFLDIDHLSHEGIVCPDCGAIFDKEDNVVFDVAPSFQDYGRS